ncbi:MAG TPA: hypothetical protein VJ489_03190 [Thermoplasmata archaeon]|nr:hypothetical protein [Thermoplasmata archaeon]
MASLDPGLLRDLTEAKADLARHGIVIVRTIETELEPAIMSQVKALLASSPKRMSQLEEDELDAFLEKLRKTSEKSVRQLRDLYVRLLAKLGTEFLGDLAKELDGIEQLIKWERIAKTVEPVNGKLSEEGFGPIELVGADSISDSFQVELEQKWPASFERFKVLVKDAAAQLARIEATEDERARPLKTKKASRKG